MVIINVIGGVRQKVGRPVIQEQMVSRLITLESESSEYDMRMDHRTENKILF